MIELVPTVLGIAVPDVTLDRVRQTLNQAIEELEFEDSPTAAALAQVRDVVLRLLTAGAPEV